MTLIVAENSQIQLKTNFDAAIHFLGSTLFFVSTAPGNSFPECAIPFLPVAYLFLFSIKGAFSA